MNIRIQIKNLKKELNNIEIVKNNTNKIILNEVLLTKEIFLRKSIEVLEKKSSMLKNINTH